MQLVLGFFCKTKLKHDAACNLKSFWDSKAENMVVQVLEVTFRVARVIVYIASLFSGSRRYKSLCSLIYAKTSNYNAFSMWEGAIVSLCRVDHFSVIRPYISTNSAICRARISDRVSFALKSALTVRRMFNIIMKQFQRFQ
jgi:hypothetical protein